MAILKATAWIGTECRRSGLELTEGLRNGWREAVKDVCKTGATRIVVETARGRFFFSPEVFAVGRKSERKK